MVGRMPRGGRSTQGAGSQAALRTSNRLRVVNALRVGGPATQASLVEVTSLSSATISNVVRDLKAQGLVRTEPTTRSGRRAVLVRLAGGDSARVAVGIDVGRRHLRVLLASPGREVLAERVFDLPLGHAPEATLPLVRKAVEECLADTATARGDVLGCGIGMPTPLDRAGKVGHLELLPQWGSMVPAEAFEATLGLPCVVDNDANLGALAEESWGQWRDAQTLLYVKVGTGIGCGLLLGGRVHRGATGMAGEFGHAGAADSGPPCRCGNRGCLESLASTRAMTAALSAALGREVDVPGLIGMAHDAHAAATRIVEDAGFALGRVLASATDLLSPDVIVIGGPVLPLGDLLLDQVRRGLRRFGTPPIAAETQVVMSGLGERAEALGAASLVLAESPVGELAVAVTDLGATATG